MNTPTPAELKRIKEAVTAALDHNHRTHQQWHWDTGSTNCPWGCGDGSGITDGTV